jgi:GSH-dependent disulfide-bond oxidoreductase
VNHHGSASCRLEDISVFALIVDPLPARGRGFVVLVTPLKLPRARILPECAVSEEVLMLEVWSWPTPNGHKVHIALEELGLQYKVIPVNIGAGDQFKPEFLKINPNHRIPAIVDPDGPGGKPFTLFESAAILIYLSEKNGGKLIPKDPIGRYKCLEWMMFQMGGVGPMFGQWNHFGAYAAEKIPYAIERYTNEVKRLTRVLNHRFDEVRWLAGDEYSMADIITFPWIRTAVETGARFAERGSIDLDDYPAVKRWHNDMAARPAVQRGLAVLADYQADRQISETERENMFGETQFAVR